MFSLMKLTDKGSPFLVLTGRKHGSARKGAEATKLEDAILQIKAKKNAGAGVENLVIKINAAGKYRLEESHARSR